ncbi:hypothetical protein GUJ93_ZPchr0012g22013 [Zizania palustris]|uniref:Uncharacterized protein n=1 Tax=Zizania palustris TaxID=103762 RepID=A0A8J6BTW7_ZIZPA|nr:hypothetical protein GUJ93_ZPchr0012g22013 [Zizania palustris]
MGLTDPAKHQTALAEPVTRRARDLPFASAPPTVALFFSCTSSPPLFTKAATPPHVSSPVHPAPQPFSPLSSPPSAATEFRRVHPTRPMCLPCRAETLEVRRS